MINYLLLGVAEGRLEGSHTSAGRYERGLGRGWGLCPWVITPRSQLSEHIFRFPPQHLCWATVSRHNSHTHRSTAPPLTTHQPKAHQTITHQSTQHQSTSHQTTSHKLISRQPTTHQPNKHQPLTASKRHYSESIFGPKITIKIDDKPVNNC